METLILIQRQDGITTHFHQVVESNNIKILWDIVIQCDKEIEVRRPDIVTVNKVQNEATLIEVAIPGYVIVPEKDIEQIRKNGPLSTFFGKRGRQFYFHFPSFYNPFLVAFRTIKCNDSIMHTLFYCHI